MSKESPIDTSRVSPDLSREVESHAAVQAALIEAIEQPLAAIGADGRLMAGNAAYRREFERLYGVPVSIGDDIFAHSVHLPNEAERLQGLIGRALAGESFSATAEMGDPRFARKLYHILLAPIPDAEGVITAVAFASTDITERTRAETRIRQSEQRFRDLAANLPGAVYQWVERKDGTRGFRWISPRLSEIFGLTEAQLEDVGSVIHPDDRARWVESIEESNRSGGVWNYEGRLLYPDGRIKWWQGISRPTHVADDEIIYNGVMLDITDRKLAEHEVRLAAKVFESSHEGVMIMDESRRVASVNRAFTAITGFRREEVLGEPPRVLESGRHDANFLASLWAAATGETGWEGELWLRRRDQLVFPAWTRLTAVRDDAGTITQYIGVFEDISERKAQEARIHHLAQHDFLTGLPNRALLEDRMRKALPLAQRTGSRLAVLFMDLDRFKIINDSLGHQVGDQLLRQVARRLAGCVRAADTVSRQGGDEFVLLLQDLDEPDHAAAVAMKVLEVISDPFSIDGMNLSVTPSIGVAMYPEDGTEFPVLLRNADAAMYHAKAVGRNNFQFFTQAMNSRVLERVDIEARLRRALRGGEFSVHYQPRIDLATDRVAGLEALLRWTDPDLGPVPSERFIPIAEESGMILAVGEWVIREVCRQCAEWRREAAMDVPVSINVSAVQFRQRGLEEMVRSALETHGLDASQLELELTESAIMEDVEEARGVLDRLKARGIQISVDDFGTGYSSLAYLRRLPLDRLKIDRSFVNDVTDDPEDAVITTAIIGMAKTLGLKTLAEGIETPSQLAFFRERGCDEAQGFLLAKPMPSDELLTWWVAREAR